MHINIHIELGLCTLNQCLFRSLVMETKQVTSTHHKSLMIVYGKSF